MGDRGSCHLSRLLLHLLLALSVLSLLPQGMLGRPGALRAEEEGGAGSRAPPRRVKRGWVWNQFFVLEEYMGMEPLYIGKVSRLPNACTCARTHTHSRAWTSARRNTSGTHRHKHTHMH